MDTLMMIMQWVLVLVVVLFFIVIVVAAYRVYRGTDSATRKGLNVKVKVGEKVVAVKQSIKGKREVID